MFYMKVVQVEPGKPWAKVSQTKKSISQRKNLPIECVQGDQPVGCPNVGGDVKNHMMWCGEVW